uniref:subtilisin n=1 Tax=Ditylum brightwellii TaxID=49249 RepID=A0A6U3P181_9STRA|mmetsp:Transcript_12589/g.18825  ORF Transcript_12589/g.18825 Transcript_12589/m.18825 type:complete len:509 (+) Transcript_12589:676-2202(+)
MDAVEACVTAGAKVVSMSLGGSGFSQFADQQYKDHYDNDGVLFIAAAGNGGVGSYLYPASYKYVMSVAAVDSDKNKASFSQFNDQVEIAAPGVSVLSTLPDDEYAYWSGTSMATPHVAGVAALVWSHFPDCSNKQIREALIASAQDLGDVGCDNDYGFGLVEARAAYDYLSNRGCGFPVGDTLGGCNQCMECTSTPTSSPTPFVCPGSEKRFKLSLVTDKYGSETSWKVTSPTGGDVISRSGYARYTTYTERHCIQSDACTFEISDSYGDGICCTHGDGSYKIWVDDVEKGTGGDFGSTETIQFCDASPTSPTTVTPTVSPTVPPTVLPTVPPTVPPTPAPVTPTTPPTTPPVSCLTVKIDILTDLYPAETSWTISDQEGNEVASGSGYTQNDKNYIQDQCLESNNVHTFSISDTWGDGICCSYGSGSYQLSLGETTFIEGGDFGSSVEHRFLLLDVDTVMIDHSTCAGEAVNGANNMDDFVKRGAGEKCKGGQHCLSNRCDGNGICE